MTVVGFWGLVVAGFGRGLVLTRKGEVAVGGVNPCTAAHGTPEDKRRKLVQVLWLGLGFCQRRTGGWWLMGVRGFGEPNAGVQGFCG